MRRIRVGSSRLLAMLAVLATSTGLLVVIGASPAAAAPQQFYAMHWNIAGATTHDGDPDKPNNYGSTLVTERLADFAATWRPSVISVSEVCDGQVDTLRGHLEDRGLHVYAVAFSGTKTELPGPIPDGPHPACLLSGGYYVGVALLSLVPAVDPDSLWFDEETNQVVHHRTTRAGACLTLQLSRNVRACSLHLAQNSTEAISQAQQFVNTYRTDIESYPYMLLGDFNATPDQLLGTMYHPSAGGFGHFYEADMDAANLGLPTFGDHKIDYAFVSSNAFARDQLALATIDPGTCRVENAFQLPWFVLYPHPCSDHRAIVASVTLLDGSGGGGGGEGGFPPQPAPVDLPPTVSAGADVTGVEGGSVQLNGAVSDREGTPAFRWEYSTAGRTVEAGVRCSFGDPHALSTTFGCTDDGTFYVGLTADDGVNPPVTDVLKVTLSNAPPVLRLTAPQPWQVYRAGATVTVRAPFTDAGTNDTHACTVAWDDGATESFPPTGGNCERTHTYANAGMYTISITVTDDDGGADSETVLVVAYDPDGGFVTLGGFLDSPAGALITDPAVTGKLQVELNPKYLGGDSGPVPSSGKVKARLNGSFQLKSSALEWLVVAPDGRVAVKGTGTVNGQPGYGFVTYGYDAEPDSLRLVVWPLSSGPVPATGTAVYDNRPAAGYDLDLADPQPLDGGSLNVHQ